MNRLARKGLVSAMVAGGVLASAGYAAGSAQADSAAGGKAAGSPGILSGNEVQVPVHAPVNVCGDSLSVAGLLNPAFGNECANAPAPAAQTPAPPAHAPQPAPPADTSTAAPTLAHTGAAGVGAAAAGGLALLLGGTVLYRRATSAARG